MYTYVHTYMVTKNGSHNPCLHVGQSIIIIIIIIIIIKDCHKIFKFGAITGPGDQILLAISGPRLLVAAHKWSHWTKGPVIVWQAISGNISSGQYYNTKYARLTKCQASITLNWQTFCHQVADRSSCPSLLKDRNEWSVVRHISSDILSFDWLAVNN